VIGIIGAVRMKSMLNLMRDDRPPAELNLIGREPDNRPRRHFCAGCASCCWDWRWKPTRAYFSMSAGA
jgi:hypothetical protein